MICVINQPHCYPYLGYFALMVSADKFVFLDDVQLSRTSWQTRNRIKNGNDYEWLSIPVKADLKTKIKDVELVPGDNWKEKHLGILKTVYRNAPYLDEILPALEYWLSYPTNLLADMTIQIAVRIARRIGIQTAFYKTSELVEAGYTFDGLKDVRIANICYDLYCDSYLSPCGSAEYIEARTPGGAFKEKNITLYYQHYVCEPYPQQGNEFLPYCSVLDLLMNVGFDHALEYIKAGMKPHYGYLDFRREVLKLD